MPITSSYFLPAVILNPVVMLHAVNTYFAYTFPPTLSVSASPHSTIGKFGPSPGSAPYFDVHSSDQVCWTYTIIMVIAQVLTYIKVVGNRVERKAKLRRDGNRISRSRWSEEPESPKVEEGSYSWERNTDKGTLNGMNGKANGVNGHAQPPKPIRRQTRMVRQIQRTTHNRCRPRHQNELHRQASHEPAEDSEGDVYGDSVERLRNEVGEDGSDHGTITTSEDEFIP